MPEGPTVQRLLDLGFDALPVAAVVVDGDRTVVAVNRRFEVLTGWDRDRIVGRPTTVLRGPGTRWAASTALSAALAAGEGWEGEMLTYRADGSAFWDLVAFRPLETGGGRYFVGTMLDVTELVGLRRRGRERDDVVATLLELAGRLGASTDRAGVARALAAAVTRLGPARAAVAVAEGADLRVLGAAGWPLGGDGPEGTELVLAPGHLAAPITAVELALVPGAAASPTWVVPLVRDDEVLGAVLAERGDPPDALVEDRLVRAARLATIALDNLAVLDEIREAADRDPLTALLTRAALVRRFTAGLDRIGRAEHVGAVHFDLDRFRRVNEELGHRAGDRLLQLIAERVREAAGTGALVARHGSDQVMVAVGPLGHPDDLDRLVERLESAVRRPLTVEGHVVYPTASFGRTIRRRGTQPAGDLAEGLLRAADIRMHDEKERQRTRLPAGSPVALLRLDTDLHHAVESGGVVPAFQPQYDLATGAVCGFEVLARWTHPEHGPIPPDVFIPLAEDDGLIHELGRQMLAHCRGFLAARRDRSTLAVNVSTKQLARPGFARLVEDELGGDPAALARLVVEVTESTLILDRDLVLDELGQLRALGVGIAVDDFGSGYSSLFQLQELPATELKIDRAFVQRSGAVGTSVLEAIVRLARGLDLGVVAEGVETSEQLRMLRALGCDRVQGHLLAPALPEDLAVALDPAGPLIP